MDAGLAHLSPGSLDAVAGNARRQAARCGERLRGLLQLLDHCMVMPGAPPDRDLLALVSGQSRSLLDEYERWCCLADNAAYWRDHPAAAALAVQARTAV